MAWRRLSEDTGCETLGSEDTEGTEDRGQVASKGEVRDSRREEEEEETGHMQPAKREQIRDGKRERV